MTSADLITPKELLELASLDALGLLDEFEAEVYTRVFHGSPAMVQDEILRLQAEVTNDLSLLPEEEPDPQLRQRVLKAVADAIQRSDDTLAPLARIGRQPADRLVEAHRSTAALWRAASFVLAGVSLILAYFLALGYRSSNELAIAALTDDASKLVVLLGPRSRDFLFDDSTKISLKPVTLEPSDDEDEPEPRGTLFVNEQTGQVLMLVDGLKPTQNAAYRLQVTRSDDEPVRVHGFPGLRGMVADRIDEVPSTLIRAALTWQIVTLDGTVLLSS